MIGVGDVDLEDEQVRRFWGQGFLCLGRMTTDQELSWLWGVYDQIVREKIGYTPDELSRVTVGVGQESLVTILYPEQVIPELRDTIFYRNVQKVFMHLFGVEGMYLLNGWRLFFKRARGDETPWHQDAAYRPPPHHGASVWMPLDPATIKSSCMHYVAGSHQEGLRPHHLHNDHLTVGEINSSQATACPLSPGEAVAHHCLTLHYAGPNKTDRPRRALVIVCQVTKDR